MNNLNFEISDNPDMKDVKALESGLSNSVPPHVELRNYKPLALFLRDKEGKIIAGLEGSTYWQWLNIRLLWVNDDLRGRGIGSKLVKKAEEVAKNRGCHASVVDTFTFQAHEFYKKLGYEVFGALENFPIGHERFYMQKKLT